MSITEWTSFLLVRIRSLDQDHVCRQIWRDIAGTHNFFTLSCIASEEKRSLLCIESNQEEAWVIYRPRKHINCTSSDLFWYCLVAEKLQIMTSSIVIQTKNQSRCRLFSHGLRGAWGNKTSFFFFSLLQIWNSDKFFFSSHAYRLAYYKMDEDLGKCLSKGSLARAAGFKLALTCTYFLLREGTSSFFSSHFFVDVTSQIITVQNCNTSSTLDELNRFCETYHSKQYKIYIM